MKKLLTLVALLALAVPAFGAGRERVLLTANYDLDATDPTYCVLLGVGDQVRSGPKPVTQLATTSGSSTTVTGLNAADDTFLVVEVGDVLVFPRTYSATTGGYTNIPEQRIVTAKASADSITVNAAIELPLVGTPFGYYEPSCGTTATSGWIGVQNLKDINFVMIVNQISVLSGGIAFTVECRNRSVGTTGDTLAAPTALTAVGVENYTVSGAWDECRVGQELSGADDAGDLTTNLEQVTIQMNARIEE